jgi:hypothetical protein
VLDPPQDSDQISNEPTDLIELEPSENEVDEEEES